MAKLIKKFYGDIELDHLTAISNAEFAKLFPGVVGHKYDGYSMMVGQPIGFKREYIQGQGWTKKLLPVERIIEYKSNPSKHVCDARCVNATGKIMKCECSCGGKNHGKGGFNCE